MARFLFFAEFIEFIQFISRRERLGMSLEIPYNSLSMFLSSFMQECGP